MPARAHLVRVVLAGLVGLGASMAELGCSIATLAERGRVRRVERRLARGANPDRRDRDGEAALHHAVRNDDVAMTRVLVDAGANVDERGPGGCVPLWLVEDPTIAELLLDAGASIDVPCGMTDTTPLVWALTSGKIEVAQVLLRHGAASLRINEHGETAFELALHSRDPEVITLVLRRLGAGNPPVGPARGTTILHHAAARGDVAELRSSLVNSDPDHGDYVGCTPLAYAAAQGQLEAVTLLLEAGARVGSRCGLEEQTPLMLAAVFGSAPVVAALLDQGADPDARARDGWTAVMLAADRGFDGVVDLLVARGADPTTAAMDGTRLSDLRPPALRFPRTR